MRSVVIHGHFYQPPRDDPRTGAIPLEPNAAPFHDWNERIETAPIARARVGMAGTAVRSRCRTITSSCRSARGAIR